MIVFLTIVSLRFFIHRGFTDYVNKVETERLSDLLNELETEFFDGLQRTEKAFDHMLGAANSAVGGGGSASAGVSV